MKTPTLAPHAPVCPGGVPEPSDREFRMFRDLVEGASGIHLSPAKKPLLYSRLSRRIRELGLPSFDAYHRRVSADPEGGELCQMLDRITTNETHFFREPRHFDDLDGHLFPTWAAEAAQGTRPRRIRAWSAGCSTGEEPYSLAMLLLTHFPPEQGFAPEVLATDLSTRVLAQARDATWAIDKADEIPRPLLRRFMLRGIGERAGTLRAGPELRAIVRFARLNLNDDAYPVEGGLDLIFCRNVLIYFEAAGRQRVIERLAALLVPGGRLYLGHAESVRDTAGQLRCVGPATYVRVDDAGDGFHLDGKARER